MTKKVRIIAISVLAVLIVLGCIWGVHYHMKNKITFTVRDTLPDGQGKDAVVILLGGQSNASGCSLDEYLRRNVTEEKYAEYQNGYDHVYINYWAGLNVSNGFVKCATAQGEAGGHFGPELGMAEKLHEMYPDETVFIIKYAWGGSDLYAQWLSPSSKGKTGDLYKQFVAYVETSLQYLVSKNYNIRIEGMCWMQGESDAFQVKTATNYATHLENFIQDIRKEFSQYAAEDGIAFVHAYIAENPAFWVYYEMVNNGKREVAERSPLNVVVDTDMLVCTEEPIDDPDIAHYDSLSEIKLGHMFAEQLAVFMD
jgi:hypothetical protein